MGYKSNEPLGSRIFYISPVGNDTEGGRSTESPLLTIAQGITNIATLNPVSSLTDLSSITINGSATFFEQDLVTEDGCQFSGPNTIIFAVTGDGVTQGDFTFFKVGQIVTASSGKKCFILNNSLSIGIGALGTFTSGASSFGVHISGTGKELYVTVDQMNIGGDGSVGLFNGCDEANPVIGHINNFILSDNNTTAFLQDHATLNLAKTVMNIISILEDETVALTGTVGLDIEVGEADIIAGNIEASTAIHVGSGADLSIVCGCLHGDIIVDSGGVLNCDITDFSSGTITNNGTINGTIGSERYGNFTFKNDLTVDGITNIVGVGYYEIATGTQTLVPIYRQHLTTGDVEINGEMTIEGEMVVI